MCGSECTDKRSHTFCNNVHFGHSHICDSCAAETLTPMADVVADHVPLSVVSSYSMVHQPDEESADPLARVITSIFISDETALRARYRQIVSCRPHCPALIIFRFPIARSRKSVCVTAVKSECMKSASARRPRKRRTNGPRRARSRTRPRKPSWMP